MVYFDGAFSRLGTGAGAMLVSPTQDKVRYAVQLCFQRGEKVSNNIAEYEGLIAVLRAAVVLGVKRLTIRGDSQLLVNFSNKRVHPEGRAHRSIKQQFRKILICNSRIWHRSI